MPRRRGASNPVVQLPARLRALRVRRSPARLHELARSLTWRASGLQARWVELLGEACRGRSVEVAADHARDKPLVIRRRSMEAAVRPAWDRVLDLGEVQADRDSAVDWVWRAIWRRRISFAGCEVVDKQESARRELLGQRPQAGDRAVEMDDYPAGL